MPCLFPPRHYPLTRVCSHCLPYPVSFPQALPLLLSLCSLLCPVCFLPGNPLALQSVLSVYYTLYLSPRHYHYSPVCAVYYALCDSSQALPLLLCLCSLLCPVCFLQGNPLTLQSVLSVYYTLYLSPRHYHYSPVCAVYYALCHFSPALPLLIPCVIPPRHYHYSPV
jgi:hypothetical protein